MRRGRCFYLEAEFLGAFSVNSYYKFLNNGFLAVAWSKSIWQNIVPLQFRILVWLVVQNKLLTVDNLSKRNSSVRSICVFCNSHNESAYHLFVNCPGLLIWEFCQSCFSVKDKLGSPHSWRTDWRKRRIRSNRMLWEC